MSHPRAFHTQETEAKERSAAIWRLQTARIGAGSTTTKAQLHQELRTLNREMEAFIKGDDIRVFRQERALTVRCAERKMKASTRHNKAFHAVRCSGMSQSLIFDDAALDPSCSLRPEKSPHG